MKILRSIIILGVLMVLCYYGVALYQQANNRPPTVDRELRALVNQWENRMIDQHLNYRDGYRRIKTIRVSNRMDYGVAGHFDYGTREIIINRSMIDSGFFATRATLWHELGHYVFKLDHSDSPDEIMYYKTKADIEYKLYWESMADIYYNKCK